MEISMPRNESIQYASIEDQKASFYQPARRYLQFFERKSHLQGCSSAEHCGLYIGDSSIRAEDGAREWDLCNLLVT